MSFNWRDFLEFASDLHTKWVVEQGTDFESDPLAEAICRTVIGRAYYSALIAAREYLKDCGQPNNPYLRSHEAVTKPLLMPVCNGREKALARSLKTLQAKRTNADYIDTPLGKPATEAKMALELSQKAWDQLDALYDEPIVPFKDRPKLV